MEALAEEGEWEWGNGYKFRRFRHSLPVHWDAEEEDLVAGGAVCWL